jgi:hypothetical protein
MKNRLLTGLCGTIIFTPTIIFVILVLITLLLVIFMKTKIILLMLLVEIPIWMLTQNKWVMALQNWVHKPTKNNGGAQ